MILPTVIVLGLFSAVSWSKLYEDVADLPGLHYDFVVVGGGTAGNVVANRLTENPNVTVIVLEAGVSNEGVLASAVPFLLEEVLSNPTYSWNYTTPSIAGLNGRTLDYLRGCSAHNGMLYTRV
ncbi:hypothetical protein DFH06DRAFT_1166633 [Mycena polygramma]|nr:hypothetical protein DFH06DRAFT_1166633 [Mycena polygramma]